jgi:hypothetical protein
MKEINLDSVGLPKWPAFIVNGKDVTLEQAMEIMIRTTRMRFSSNDRAFERQLYSFLNVRSDSMGYPEWEDIDKVESELGAVMVDNSSDGQYLTNLEYCDNNMVLSAWVGGPHGWISWDGKVGCNNYNIGKHPSAKEVKAEWVAIAKAFPFLDLKCQLFSGETCEDGIVPVIQYNISKGKVKVVVPKKVLSKFDSDTDITNLFAPGRERGCTLEQFKLAVNFVREKMKNAN